MSERFCGVSYVTPDLGLLIDHPREKDQKPEAARNLTRVEWTVTLVHHVKSMVAISGSHHKQNESAWGSEVEVGRGQH